MTEPLIYHRIDFKPADPTEKLRDSIGGHPYLPKGMDYPACSCGQRMNLYLQFDIREEFGLPFQTGSHLAVFMCEAHNGFPSRQYDFFRNEAGRFQDQLRANYRDFNGSEDANWPQFFRLMLLKPGGEFEFLPAEEFIQPCSLDFTKTEEIGTEDEDAEDEVEEDDDDEADEDEDDEVEAKVVGVEAEPGFPGTSTNPWASRYSSREFKVGGQPAWGGDGEPPENLLCACGAPMGFVGFVPDRFLFPNTRTTVSSWQGVGSLFSGLCVYILACRDQCHPFAVYPVAQP
jgi:hypothetical protein